MQVDCLLIGIILYSLVFFGLMWKFGFNEYEKGIFKGIKYRISKRLLA